MTVKPVATGAAKMGDKIVKVDYNTKRAVALITGYGSRWDWYQAMVCPCVASSDNGERFTKLVCKLCYGTGWTYVFNKEIRGVSSSINRHESTLPYRVPDIGQTSNIVASLTVEPENKVNIRDKVVFKESVTFRSEVKQYDPSLTSFRMLHPIVELMQVIDENGVKYDCSNPLENRREVLVNADGELYWVDGAKRPATNVGFSVLYTYYPEYSVVDAVHEIRGAMMGGMKPEDVQEWEDLPRLLRIKLIIPDRYLYVQS